MGGEKSDGRWHTAKRGKRIVYLSDYPALALIEVLANLKGNPKLFPDCYQLMKITVADQVATGALEPNILLSNWRDDMNQTKSIGDSWLAGGNYALLAVPSVPSPESMNYLFNPLHPDATGWRSSGAGGSSTTSDCFTYPRRSDEPFDAILFS
jgi:RES domain-containing protein